MEASILPTETVQVPPDGSISLKGSTLHRTLPSDFLENFDKMSLAQAGHLRHFHNLATQLDGQWQHMGAQDPGQEWLDSYRYQLAMMAYATGLAHYHRLPALRSVFKPLLEQLIHKMLRREVWGYWYLTSQSGKFVDPDIVELRKPWADPVKRENIMYSGHLLLMVALHAMLFNDDKYDDPDALTFNWNPMLWGLGPERFTYSRTTLFQVILEEMERGKWLGACCEPNNIFVVCNQFPIIAMRFIDVRKGTSVAAEVLEKYRAAWRSRNGFNQEGELLVSWYMVKQDSMVTHGAIGSTACATAFMNAWNSDYVYSMFPSQSLGFLSKLPDGRVNLNTPAVAQSIRSLVKKEGMDKDDPETTRHARRMVAEGDKTDPWASMPPQPDFGYVAQWLSEVADESILEGLLCHADQFLNPTWERGGLFYPRMDEQQNDEGDWTAVDPYTGNAAIGYARLNVRNGLKEMWESPWYESHFLEYPFVEGVDLSSGVDFLRGCWNGAVGAMVITCRTWDGTKKRINCTVHNLPTGVYGIYKGGRLAEVSYVGNRDCVITLTLEVGPEELDVVLLRDSVESI
ncbi:hypothetical protein NM208_g12510 [Fusarium decemcellulare]|uniref:Uncharacterized protein n=1 Tax=Fusarium decemcellulare TaxID=57161 RepID=A0ACC1RNY7_9HYPO|nr:hypothetical protein NM208_g12510 [Fusarium decemcellulare]